ncbi:MAG: ABC transporter ATP-binding protein [Desulfobacterium sp.]|nr:ABC transporter ATP-binding protein [Desulfobacterium sp.]
MILMNLKNVSMGYGGPLLLENVNLQIEQGERISLIGRNGEGKSTLIKILMGQVSPDHGSVGISHGIRRACLSQEVPEEIRGSVFDVVASGYGDAAITLSEFYRISQLMSRNEDPSLFRKLEGFQQTLDETDGWKMEQKVNKVITRLTLEPNAVFDHLSAGLKRRVLLAKALVSDPDLLLLDEPTNHLDIRAIEYLEEYLASYSGTLLFVTHDRMFLKKLANRIIEMDRGSLFNWKCNYDTFLKRKESDLASEEKQNATFDKKLEKEEKWIRQGVKARRTRNEGRVSALEKMRELRKQRRNQIGSVRLQAQEAEKSGKLVIEAEQITFQWDGIDIVRDFSTTILRGDKVGIIGPNGVGKTTLLKILLGEIPPTHGTLRLGTRIHVAYFDQLRARLDEDKTVQDNICNGNDMITVNQKPRHVIGYLQDFLFTPAQARSPVRTLSGGERNRLLLASLFAKESNVLVMDEPTNDLDMETLELLEDLLLNYSGTLLLISHDRTFLNNVVTSTLVFEEMGKVTEYVGGYDDWISQRPAGTPLEKQVPQTKKSMQMKNTAKKLSYNEQRELNSFPGKIEALEKEQGMLYAAMSDPKFYQREGTEILSIKERLGALERMLEEVYARWEHLESKS